MLSLKGVLALLLLYNMAALPVPLNVLAEHQAVLELLPIKPRLTLPVANSTESFWLRAPNVLPLPTHGSEGPLATDADICIIGSGMTGVSAAYHLANSFSNRARESPLKVTILEAREFCSGATGRNGGHLTPNAFEGFRHQEHTYGKDEAIRSIAIENYTTEAIRKILQDNDKVNHVDFVSGGRIILTFSPREYEEAMADHAAAERASIDLRGVEWLSKEEVEMQYHTSYPAVVVPGNNFWPLKFASVLYNLAENASDNLSLTLHTRTPVTSISPLSNASTGESRRWNLTTPRGSISCSYVLHATNAYASHLLPWLQGPDGIVPTRGQVIATRAKTKLPLGRAAFLGNDGLEYWFPRPPSGTNPDENQLVILGGGREATKDRQFEFNEVNDSVVNAEVSKVLRKFLPAVYPSEFDENTEPEIEWTGIMGFTKSGDPFVGPVIDPANGAKYEGQYISAGYTGHGMPRAFACAEIVAGMIYADITGSKWTAPDWLPLHYLTQK